ncbi:PAS domain-containing sensor histidine kinase [Flavobacterium zepuense]|uniref:histidine kinase n=1 Tax=Flavobacterium zepuense TaxID=2593302 RepID=A0A552V2U4_9FLAO|nr:PAS domain-containing sensor histidine kinase [Flavobacterium zepuense]TRW24777.1 PAS domain-containing sensor histidine kinase [Flavobacterium zepuense]
MPDNNETKSINAFYKKLIDEVPDLIFKAEYTNGKYSVVFCSESVRDIYEVTPEEFIADPDYIITHRILPLDRAMFAKKLEVSRIRLKRYDHDYRVKLPQKGLRWLKVTGKPEEIEGGGVAFYTRVSDITDLKLQEQKLQVSEERYKFALEAASEGLWDWDITKRTVYFSGQAMKIIGRENKDATVPQSFWASRVHPDDVKARDEAKRKGLRRGASYESIYRIRTDEGKYRWLLSRGRAVEFDKNGKATRAIGMHKDITLLKEKEIQLGNTITIIGNQNNRLSNFAHIVSHNLRSHASNLKMLLDLFKNADNEEREEMLSHLEGISDGLTITISHLKELVEIQTEVKTVKEHLNLRHYLKNILTILHHEITKHSVTIEINIPLDVTVNYNAAYLESVLLNFTTNAIKYSSSERKPIISYDFEIEDGKKVLSISDNGLGIDLKKHKNSLFGMYKTFHKNQNSRGIGLFITKNQIEAMGGKIEVTSEVNRGTTFKIYFNEED